MNLNSLFINVQEFMNCSSWFLTVFAGMYGLILGLSTNYLIRHGIVQIASPLHQPLFIQLFFLLNVSILILFGIQYFAGLGNNVTFVNVLTGLRIISLIYGFSIALSCLYQVLAA